MTHEEISRKGGVVKSLAKLTAANHNLAKAQEARKEKQAAKKKAAGAS